MKQVIVDGICLPKTLKCASFGMTIPRIAKYFNILEISFSCETDFFYFIFGQVNSIQCLSLRAYAIDAVDWHH